MNRPTLALLLLTATPLLAQDPPHRAAIPVPLTDDTTRTLPTWDGRVLIARRQVNGTSGLVAYVFRPEAVGTSATGTPTFPLGCRSGEVLMELGDHQRGGAIGHTLAAAPGYPENPFRSDAGGAPRPDGDHACYELLVYSEAPLLPPRIGVRRARVVVAEPRTPRARVAVATFLGPLQLLRTTTGAPVHGLGPTCTVDGRLLVINGRGNEPVVDTLTTYAWNHTPGAVDGWTTPRTIADLVLERDALVDGLRLADRWPLAARPLRHQDGRPLRPGEPFAGSYVWLSHDGGELVFTASAIPGKGNLAALSMVGRLTAWSVRHLDGALNPDRATTERQLFFSPGAAPGFWTPFRGAGAPIPSGARRPIVPLFTSGKGGPRYGEVPCDHPDGDAALHLACNELITDQVVPAANFTSAHLLDPTRTPDSSGWCNVGLLEEGAVFPQELPPGYAQDRALGAIGQAVLFPQAGAVRVRASASLDQPRGALTVQAFVQRALAFDRPVSLVHREGAYSLSLLPDGRVEASVTSGGAPRRSGPAGPAVEVGRWTHVALTWAGATGELKVWIGGREAARSLHPPGDVAATAADLLVGPARLAPPSAFVPATRIVALLDEVSVSRVVRTPEELALAAEAPLPPPSFLDVPASSLPPGLDPRDARIPADRAPTPASVALGRRLFLDPRLSRDGTVSCATCHRPDAAFTDGLATAVGIDGQRGTRNTPTVLNRAFGTRQFLDGRAADLEAQALQPIADPAEMGSSVADVVAYLAADPTYGAQFQQAFGAPPSADGLARALAAFQRALLSGGSRVDRFEAGEHAALTPAEQRGRALFHGQARCTACHSGSNLSDEAFHFTGLPQAGWGRALITGRARDVGAFKTPTLRDVSRTAPYFHDGRAGTLEEVVEFYDRGGDVAAGRDAEMFPLGLTAAQRADLVAFLRALDGAAQ